MERKGREREKEKEEKEEKKEKKGKKGKKKEGKLAPWGWVRCSSAAPLNLKLEPPKPTQANSSLSFLSPTLYL